MTQCSTHGCYRPGYWRLDENRIFCTAVHLNDEIGARTLWTAGKQSDGERAVILHA